MTAQRLILVRHGQSEANVAGVLEASGDSPLTEAGRAQAAALALRLAESDLETVVVIASQSRRAADTARAIADALRVDLDHDHRLREGAVADWEGVAFTEIEARVTAAGRKFLDHDLHGGEAPKEISARVREALEEARQRQVRTVIFVMHGYSLRMLAWSLYEGRSDGGIGDEGVGNCDAFEIPLGPEGVTGPIRRF